jgi:hypothetical protein
MPGRGRTDREGPRIEPRRAVEAALSPRRLRRARERKRDQDQVIANIGFDAKNSGITAGRMRIGGDSRKWADLER